MDRSVKTLVKRPAKALLAWEPVTTMLRTPVSSVLRALERTHGLLSKVHRNLPAADRLFEQRSETKTQVVSRYYLELAERVRDLPYQPLISVLVPVYRVDPAYFRECLLSVTKQVYPHWELCIVDDCSDRPEITSIIREFTQNHPGRVKSAVNPKNVHISATSNACLDLATGDYVALLDHDDRLYLNALAEMVRYMNLHDQPDILYSDECTIDKEGNRCKDTFFKPDWSPFMHLTMNYTTHLSVYRRSLMQKVGGFRVGYEGSQDHDLMLRMVEASAKPVVHVPFCLYQWRAHPASTAHSQDSKPYAAIAGEKAVKEHLERRGRPATVTFNPKTLIYRLNFDLPNPRPLISIVIPSKDSAQLISKCLTSIIDKTTYPNYEIIISDNGTTDAAALAAYDSAKARLGDRLKVLCKPRPFNFGAQINDGVRAAKGTYVLLLNNDTEVWEPAWLEELLGLAQFPEVGAVGCRLFFKNRLTQHAGIVLSTGAIAEHLGLYLCEKYPLYWNTINTIHETMAVTAACMMIQKEKFWQVGGMDEVHLPRGYGDVEFCLALRDKGYTNLYTPFARVYHDESVSRGRSVEFYERFFLLSRRGQELAADPYLNFNFRRNPRYEVEPFYSMLDLDRQEFAFFLSTPTDAWRQTSATLDY